MGYEISASQLTEITKYGIGTFVDFFTEQEAQILKHGDGKRDSFQRCPLTKKIVTSRDLGKLLFEITNKRPIRLVMTTKVSAGEIFYAKDISIEEIYLCIYYSFEDLTAQFFLSDYEIEFPDNGFVALYGDARARYMQKDFDDNRQFLLNQGYSSGDKLKTESYPFVFK